MKNSLISNLLKYGLIVLACFYLMSCTKKDSTSVEGYVYDSTDIKNIKPMVGAKLKVGSFGGGGWLFTSSSAVLGTTYSDTNGYYKLQFESEDHDKFDIRCS